LPTCGNTESTLKGSMSTELSRSLNEGRCACGAEKPITVGVDVSGNGEALGGNGPTDPP
jgi:hypothetical protein